jgi:3-methylcrotonyl-CoA carboxylase alpha subunit
MIKRILIANRGEIARRIIRTAKSMEIQTVALFSEDEPKNSWNQEADNSACIGNGNLNNTWLNGSKIIAIAKKYKCNAIHPGYGFLAENAAFARACLENDIVFIGPKPEVIQLMGNKIQSRKLVKSLGLPVPQGLEGNTTEILSKADNLTYPVLIKASAGGGGKGMIMCYSKTNLAENLEKASRQAEKWFGEGAVFVEPYFEKARHIEVQILADHYGNTLHLFERDCSLQRKYQKIIEEAPSPALTAEQRNNVCNSAIAIAKGSNYTNAGTVEFLFDGKQFYFLEMNTRIQVEHPVTEAITGIDIVEHQIRIASGEKLSFSQNGISIKGHAIETRVYAENPYDDFKPQGGNLVFVQEPQIEKVRIEAAYNKPYSLSSLYDPLIAKVITHAKNRKESLELMKSALGNYAILGIKHNVNYLLDLITNQQVSKGEYYTQFIQKEFRAIEDRPSPETKALLSAAILSYGIFSKEKKRTNNFFSNTLSNTFHLRLFLYDWFEVSGHYHLGKLFLSIEGKEFEFQPKQKSTNEITLIETEQNHILFIEQGEKEWYVQINGKQYMISGQNFTGMTQITKTQNTENPIGKIDIHSPLHGKVLSVFVNEGQAVCKGDPLISIESMKSENTIESPLDGIVVKIFAQQETPIAEKEIMLQINSN